MLNGVGMWNAEGGGKVERVPASKADVFNHPTLSLVEKRRLTKLLLLAAGGEAFEENELLKGGSPGICSTARCQRCSPLTSTEPKTTLQSFLQKGFNLSAAVASSLAYALALASSPEGQYGPQTPYRTSADC